MSLIDFEKEEHAARIILNRPPLNAMNIEMMTQLGGCSRFAP